MVSLLLVIAARLSRYSVRWPWQRVPLSIGYLQPAFVCGWCQHVTQKITGQDGNKATSPCCSTEWRGPVLQPLPHTAPRELLSAVSMERDDGSCTASCFIFISWEGQFGSTTCQLTIQNQAVNHFVIWTGPCLSARHEGLPGPAR